MLDPDYKPWPRLRPNDPKLRNWCDDRADKKTAGLAKLQSHCDSHDKVAYDEVLREVVALFGEGMQEPLHFTANHGGLPCLEVTDDKFRMSNMKEWEKGLASKLRSDNNPAERPFAVAKALLHVFPCMTIANLGRLDHARANGTLKLASTNGRKKIRSPRPKLERR